VLIAIFSIQKHKDTNKTLRTLVIFELVIQTFLTLVIWGKPRTNIKMTMQMVNWSRLGRKTFGQLSTNPQMSDSKMQNCESKPKASNMTKKRIDQTQEGES